MFDKFIMASQMVAIVEENKRQRILSELDQYDPKVFAIFKEVLMGMALGENREYNISLIWAENDERFRTQFMDIAGKFGYLVVQHANTSPQYFLSTFSLGRK